MKTLKLFCEIGQSIGMVMKCVDEKGFEHVELSESKIKRISILKFGIHVYTEKFYSLSHDNIKANTELLMNKGKIAFSAPFLLTDETRAKVERLIERRNLSAQI